MFQVVTLLAFAIATTTSRNEEMILVGTNDEDGHALQAEPPPTRETKYGASIQACALELTPIEVPTGPDLRLRAASHSDLINKSGSPQKARSQRQLFSPNGST